MRSPTMMLFSLVICAGIMVFTASRLQGLMDDGILPGGQDTAGEETGPTVPERLAETTGQWRDGAVDLYQSVASLFREEEEPGPTVITEETVETVWTWTDDRGEQQFSREDPGLEQAHSFLYPRDMALPDEVEQPAPSGTATARHASVNTEGASADAEGEASDTAPPPAEEVKLEDMDLKEGLRQFRKYQEHLQQGRQ